MRILLDTHGLLWALFEPRRIPEASRNALLDPANDVSVSIASAWEVAIKSGLGKLTLPGSLEDAVYDCGFRFLDITPEHCQAYGDLPRYEDHRDPFDRMLAVQAKLDGRRLMSNDRKLDRYGIQRIW